MCPISVYQQERLRTITMMMMTTMFTTQHSHIQYTHAHHQQQQQQLQKQEDPKQKTVGAKEHLIKDHGTYRLVKRPDGTMSETERIEWEVHRQRSLEKSHTFRNVFLLMLGAMVVAIMVM